VRVGDVKYVIWKQLQNDSILLAIDWAQGTMLFDIRVPESAPPWLQTLEAHQRHSSLCSTRKSTKVVRIANTSTMT
jgi:hypothetical protein